MVNFGNLIHYTEYQMSTIMAKFCTDCKWSLVHNRYTLLCTHPKILKKSPEMLTKVNPKGLPCIEQRVNSWFHPCGLKGRLWEFNTEKS